LNAFLRARCLLSPFVERERLPPISTVYFAFSSTGEILYIGRTIDLCRRWTVHHRLRQLEQLGCTRIAWHAANREVLEGIESAMIQESQPPLNRPWAPPLAQHKPVGIHRLACRLPEDLYKAIQQTAKADTRPINSQVIVLLREPSVSAQNSL
jgi:hypothetical protein